MARRIGGPPRTLLQNIGRPGIGAADEGVTVKQTRPRPSSSGAFGIALVPSSNPDRQRCARAGQLLLMRVRASFVGGEASFASARSPGTHTPITQRCTKGGE